MKKTHDITPSTAMILALHRAKLDWATCLSELIDNSLDAGANSVRIEFKNKNKTLLVADDGKGCDEIEPMLQLGNHAPHASTRLGMYGVGLKDAALWLWGITVISSVRGGMLRTARVDWDKVAKSGSWKIDSDEEEATPEVCEPQGVNPKHGTTICFLKTSKRPREIPSICAKLGYIFAPAIKGGRSIQIIDKGKTFPVAAFEIPPLENVIDVSKECNGKAFRVRAGVVPDGQPNPKPGFTITYRHRVIKQTSEGCGDYGSARFFGWVELSDGWKLSRNKDELVEDAEQLSDDLFWICQAQLQTAANQASIIDLAGIEAGIESALQNSLQANRKEKRNPRSNESGPVEPKNTGRERRSASKTQISDKPFVAAIGSKVKVQIVETDETERRIGWAETTSHGPLITLSGRHPFIQWARGDKDSTPLLTLLAASILGINVACSTNDKIRQKFLPDIEAAEHEERFLQGLALYLSHIAPKPQEVA